MFTDNVLENSLRFCLHLGDGLYFFPVFSFVSHIRQFGGIIVTGEVVSIMNSVFIPSTFASLCRV